MANKGYETNAGTSTPSRPKFQLEYATYPTKVLWQEYLPQPDQPTYHPIPIPKPLLDAELARYSATDTLVLPKPIRAKTDWEYDALTIDSYLDLSIRLRNSRRNYVPDPSAPGRTLSRETLSDGLESTLWGRCIDRLYAQSGVEVESV